MTTFVFRNWLPPKLRASLWGDRERWGLVINPEDEDWIKWQTTYITFYRDTQRSGVGEIINDAGYKIMETIDLTDKTVLEIGAGDIRHLKYLKGKPRGYILSDISNEMMKFAQAKLNEKNICHESILLERNQLLPLDDSSVDVIVSFYSLEHLYPLRSYLEEMHRVLKPGGRLIGAIPAEGGIAWGVGRKITSAHWFNKNTTINHNKIMCWEHPNFADQIIQELSLVFDQNHIHFWPLPWLPLIDFNLILRLDFQKKAD